jgi:hypothetical protein
MTDTLETVSMHEIALELRDEEKKDDKRYHVLQDIAENCDLDKKEADELEKLMKKYDMDNYYRNILRYAVNIFQYGTPMVKINNSDKDEYVIPSNEAWLVKTILREYMSPFLKILRTKRSSQISFTNFDEFIMRVEKAIEEKYDKEVERNVELTLLNLYTDFQRRRQLFQIKQDVEKAISKDWQMVHQLENTQLKIELLDSYRRSIQDFSVKWQKEIRKELDIEEAIMDEMVEEELKLFPFDKKGEIALNEVLQSDFQDMSIPYSEEDKDIVWEDVLSEEEIKKYDDKRMKWEKILRYEK